MTPPARAFATWAAATAIAAGVVLALALLLAGGAPAPAPPGLPAPDRVAAWIGELAAFGSLLLGVVAVGLGVWAVPWFGRPALAAPAAAVAAAWVAVSVLQLGLRAWELDAMGGLFAGSQGEALVVQAVLALVAAAGWSVDAAAPGRTLALPAALGALLPVALVGHPRSADHPWLAGASVAVHVVAAALWVGGLAAMAWLAAAPSGQWGTALRRYSSLAAVCAAAVAGSGVAAALGRIGPGELLTSRYGALVGLKIAAMIGLVGAGWLQRRYVVSRFAAPPRAFVALAALELTTMAFALALAAALAETPPPS